MSTREIAYGMIDRLDEEQLNALLVILGGLVHDEKPKEKIKAASVRGIFHDVANPELVPLEKYAWEQAAVEKHIRQMEEMKHDHS